MMKINLNNKELLNVHKNTYAYFVFSILFSIFILFYKLGNFDISNGRFLWAEDGSIFYNQANAHGFKSLFLPYAGYLHFYPRLIAIFATKFDLSYYPLFTFMGWLISYLWMIYTLSFFNNKNQISFFFNLMTIFLVVFQPHSGEVFLNITNAQWLLGLTFILLIIDDYEIKKSTVIIQLIHYLILGLLCFTGPFCFVALFIIVIKKILNDAIKKDDLKTFFLHLISNLKRSEIIILISVFIQLIVLFLFPRPDTGPIEQSVLNWLFSFIKLCLFSSDKNKILIIIILFWFLYFKSLVTANKLNIANKHILFISSIVMFLLLSMWSHKNNPQEIVFLNSGDRYTWIPYSLIIISAIHLVKNNVFVKWICIFSLLIVCGSTYSRIHHPYLNFDAYVKFSKLKNFTIPVNPQQRVPIPLNDLPIWYIQNIPQAIKKELNFETIKLKEIDYNNGIINYLDSFRIKIASDKIDPFLIFKNPINVKKAKYILFEIEGERNNEGWIQLFWNNSLEFNETNSFRRWYPSGKFVAHFAFKNKEMSNLFFRLDPMDGLGEFELTSINVYYLEN